MNAYRWFVLGFLYLLYLPMANANWQTMVIDSNVTTGSQIDMAYDPVTTCPLIAYYRGANAAEVIAASCTNRGQWATSKVNVANGYDDDSFPIALNFRQNTAQIVYQRVALDAASQGLYIAENSALGTWQESCIEPGIEYRPRIWASSCDLDYDYTGAECVFYTPVAQDWNVYGFVHTGDNWKNFLTDWNDGREVKLGIKNITTSETSQSIINYFLLSSWGVKGNLIGVSTDPNIQFNKPNVTYGFDMKLRPDSNQLPVVVYLQEDSVTSTYELMLSEAFPSESGVSWVDSKVDQGIGSNSCSLGFISPDFAPVIACTHYSQITFYKKSGENWVGEVIANDCAFRSTCCVAINPHNNKAVVAYRSASGQLKVAYEQGAFPEQTAVRSWLVYR